MVHAIIVDNWIVTEFKIHSKDTILAKEDILASAALSNYATLLLLHIRFTIDPDRFGGVEVTPLPD